MNATPTEHQCVICQRRPYEKAQVCQPCRQRVEDQLAEIADLAAQLPDHLEPGQSNGQRVSGSREAPVPLDLDVLDLTNDARHTSATPAARQHPEDQIGHDSIASRLDSWVLDWIDTLRLNESPPQPTVRRLTQWLTDRLDKACNEHPAIDDFADEMRRLRTTLRGATGQLEPQPEHIAAPCPACDLITLIRRQGEDTVECGNPDCRRVLTLTEYHRWIGLVAADIRTHGDLAPA